MRSSCMFNEDDCALQLLDVAAWCRGITITLGDTGGPLRIQELSPDHALDTQFSRLLEDDLMASMRRRLPGSS